MKQMKQREGELAKLDGQILMLEEQKGQIESAHNDKDVFQVMNQATNAVKQMNKEAGVEKFEDLQD